MLGRGDRMAERRIHHDDAPGRRRGDVDVVDADAGAPDHLQAFCLLQDLGRHLVAERTAKPSKSPTSSASFSLSAPSFGWKSTSTPRSLKICTAAGESASEMRTLGGMAAAAFIAVVARESGPRLRDA